MADFFDTSTFLAAVSEDDIDHEAALRAWQSSRRPLMYVHGLLETFSILSGGRHPAALSPSEASALISHNVESAGATFVQFSSTEILSHLDKAERLGVRGGAVYDYLHVCAAREGRATCIITLNKRHFTAIAPDLAEVIKHPSEVGLKETKS